MQDTSLSAAVRDTVAPIFRHCHEFQNSAGGVESVEAVQDVSRRLSQSGTWTEHSRKQLQDDLERVRSLLPTEFGAAWDPEIQQTIGKARRLLRLIGGFVIMQE